MTSSGPGPIWPLSPATQTPLVYVPRGGLSVLYTGLFHSPFDTYLYPTPRPGTPFQYNPNSSFPFSLSFFFNKLNKAGAVQQRRTNWVGLTSFHNHV